jgi:hypothetical protein
MRVELVSDPGQIEAVVERLRPHLAILDLDMEAGGGVPGQSPPGLSGLPGPADHLSVRRSVGLAGVEERRIGGDDYLVKPVAPQHLIATARDRLEGPRAPGPAPGQTALRRRGLVQTAVSISATAR